MTLGKVRFNCRTFPVHYALGSEGQVRVVPDHGEEQAHRDDGADGVDDRIQFGFMDEVLADGQCNRAAPAGAFDRAERTL